jgi:diaminohydroxyphosphoribosylaminopyrimidine deaminase/5-amino-6-(5-phosphoribosylamino)uracil reductase
MNSDTGYMRRAAALARRGKNHVSPNPRVGALVVKAGKILSGGYHERFGAPHAEVMALAGLSETETRRATLYVTLEPCVHYGKTPPCTDRIIRSGIQRVVVAHPDPNPLVNGKGIKTLEAAGIEVVTGILEKTCRALNAPYLKYTTKKKPYITVKIAQTLDGRIAAADGNSKWISNESARRRVHRMRQEHDAVMIGIQTLLQDKPRLSIRYGLDGLVKKIILDPFLETPLTAAVFDQAPELVIIASLRQGSQEKREHLIQKGITVWEFAGEGETIPLESLWTKMGESGITSVLVEGGARLFSAVLKSGETDRVIIITAPKILGQGLPALSISGIPHMDNALTFKEFTWKSCRGDMIFEGKL